MEGRQGEIKSIGTRSSFSTLCFGVAYLVKFFCGRRWLFSLPWVIRFNFRLPNPCVVSQNFWQIQRERVQADGVWGRPCVQRPSVYHQQQQARGAGVEGGEGRSFSCVARVGISSAPAGIFVSLRIAWESSRCRGCSCWIN